MESFAGPIGISATSISKNRDREEVHNGEWKVNMKKWDSFILKVRKVDPGATASFKNPLEVFHSICQQNVKIDCPYNAYTFKKHVTTQKCLQKKDVKARLAEVGAPTLASFGFQPILHKELPPLREETCMGLSDADNPRISSFVFHCHSLGGGGQSPNAISKEVYMASYKTLSEGQKKLSTGVNNKLGAGGSITRWAPWNQLHVRRQSRSVEPKTLKRAPFHVMSVACSSNSSRSLMP